MVVECGIAFDVTNVSSLLSFPREMQRSQEGPPQVVQRSRVSDSGVDRDTRRTPPSNADHDGPPPPSSKPGWAEEGGKCGWGSQGAHATYQVRPSARASLVDFQRHLRASASEQ